MNGHSPAGSLTSALESVSSVVVGCSLSRVSEIGLSRGRCYISLYGHEAAHSASYFFGYAKFLMENFELVLNFVCTHRDCINAIVLCTAVSFCIL